MIHFAPNVYSWDSCCHLSPYVVLELHMDKKKRTELHGLDIAEIHEHGPVQRPAKCNPAHECSSRPTEARRCIGSSGAEGTGHCEVPNMGTGTQTQDL